MSDTFFRHLAMLRQIPRQPSSIDTSTIVRKLEARGFEVTVRSVQRDLDKLSSLFPLVCNDSSKPYRWAWLADAELLDIPMMDPQTALTLGLASEFLTPLLPRSSLRYLEPHFERARAVLADLSTSRIASWPDKIRVLGRGQPLRPPTVRADVVEVVYTALLENRRFHGRYRRRKDRQIREYEVNPLALVYRPPLIYLLCTFWDYDEVNQMVLHRMTKAQLLEQPRTVPKGFNVDRYIDEGGFGFHVTRHRIGLVALFDADAAWPLRETAISRDQKIIELDDGRVRLEATVPDTVELRTWLRGFGDLVEVIAPKSLRREFRQLGSSLAARYGPPTARRHPRTATAGPKKATAGKPTKPIARPQRKKPVAVKTPSAG